MAPCRSPARSPTTLRRSTPGTASGSSAAASIRRPAPDGNRPALNHARRQAPPRGSESEAAAGSAWPGTRGRCRACRSRSRRSAGSCGSSSWRQEPSSWSRNTAATWSHQVAYHAAYDGSPVAACSAAAVAVASAATQCIRSRTTGSALPVHGVDEAVRTVDRPALADRGVEQGHARRRAATPGPRARVRHAGAAPAGPTPASDRSSRRTGRNGCAGCRCCSPAAGSTCSSKCSGMPPVVAGGRARAPPGSTIRSARSAAPVAGHVGGGEQRLDGVHVGVHAAVARPGSMNDSSHSSTTIPCSSSQKRVEQHLERLVEQLAAAGAAGARSRSRPPAPRTRARRPSSRVTRARRRRPRRTSRRGCGRGTARAARRRRGRPARRHPAGPAGGRARTRASSGR